MPKGILKLGKTNKGSVYVQLDRLNDKPPMPLSYVSFKDLSLDGKECEYDMENGKVTRIKVDGQTVFGAVQQTPQTQPVQRVVGQDANNNYSMPDSLKIENTLLPKPIQALITGDIDNFNLKLQKASRLEKDNKGKDKFYFFKNDYRKDKAGNETGHKFMILPNYGHVASNFEQICKRQKQQAETLTFNLPLVFSPDWRLIVGIGSASVYEVGMTLHHIYGIPYIPASSIKGLVRTWLIQNGWGMEEESEADAFQESKLMCDIFGCPEKTEYGDKPKKNKPSYYKANHPTIAEKQGDVVFFDAFPMSAPKIEADIMNVHYPDYYKDDEGRTAPTDFQSPNPIPFLTVGNKDLNGQSLKFQSYIGIKENKKIGDVKQKLIDSTSLTNESTILEFVQYWLNNALSSHGIGAKTAVGYGYMKQQT